MVSMESTLRAMELNGVWSEFASEGLDMGLCIEPCSTVGGHKTGSLPSAMTPSEISECLGFKPNVDDDPDKVVYSWGAKVVDLESGDTYNVAVWDYKGVRWSTYGDPVILERIFKCNS